MMHRLAVDPEAQGQGVARKLIAFSEEYAVREGYTSLRLDTYAKNTVALKLYQGLGYDLRGEVNFPGERQAFRYLRRCLDKQAVKQACYGSARNAGPWRAFVFIGKLRLLSWLWGLSGCSFYLLFRFFKIGIAIRHRNKR